MNTDIFDAVNDLLSGLCPIDAVRAIEGGADHQALWAQLEASGFTDALVPEAQGGAGLGLSDALAIVTAAGRHVVPLPWAHTLLLRGALHQHGIAPPTGLMAMAQSLHASDGWRAPTPMGRDAQAVLVKGPEGWAMWPTASAQRQSPALYGSIDTTWCWAEAPEDALALPEADWSNLAALACAGLIAGALERAFDITTQYANERIQFGKPIAKLQVVQQNLSVMAEHVFASRMAAQIGFSNTGAWPDAQQAAVAKQRSSEAVAICAPIAHAVHGAMGFTAEYELQCYTRRLHEWRLAHGSEQHWAKRLGQAFMADDACALDWARRIGD